MIAAIKIRYVIKVKLRTKWTCLKTDCKHSRRLEKLDFWLKYILAG